MKRSSLCGIFLDSVMLLPKFSSSGVAYGAIMFCSSLLNNIFISYYIDLFVNVVRVEPGWFFAGQAVFMLWNAANDPLLGWISDTTSCHERSVSGLRWITASFASALVHGVAAVFRPLSPELALRLIKVFIFEGGSTGEAATAATWNRRVDMIRLGGLLWCASFLVLWWPWSAALSSQLGSDQSSAWVLSLLSGLHFTVSLCLYDGFLTYTEVNHSALLAELSLDQSARTDALSWSSIGGALGSLSSFAAYLTWSRADLAPFRWLCCIAAFSCALIFEASAAVLQRAHRASHAAAASPLVHDGDAVLVDTQTAAVPESTTDVIVAESGEQHGAAAAHSRQAHRPPAVVGPREDQATADEASSVTYSMFIGQLARHPNFRVVVAISCLQVFDCTFEKNFFAPFLDVLTTTPLGVDAASNTDQDHLRPWRGVVLLLSFLLPHVATVCWAPVIRARGLAGAFTAIFCIRIAVLALTAFLSSRESPVSVMVFMLANRVLSESVCRLFPLLLSDVIDEDAVLHNRPAALSASVIGAAGALSKLSQSLAPMIAFALLPSSQVVAGSAGSPTVAPSDPIFVKAVPESIAASADSANRVWALLLAIPSACVVLQVICWSRYTLFGSQLRHVKEARAAKEEADSKAASVGRSM